MSISHVRWLDPYSSPSGCCRPGASSAAPGASGASGHVDANLQLVARQEIHWHPFLSQGICWLVVWNMSISPYCEFHHPNWLWYFLRGRYTTDQSAIQCSIGPVIIKAAGLGFGQASCSQLSCREPEPTQGQRLTRWAQKQGWSLRVLEWDVIGFMG